MFFGDFFVLYTQNECEVVENMSPFLTCFPLLPFGRALRAGTHSARARKSTSPHYATRCVGAKKSQRTRNFVLSSGAWRSLRSSPLLLQFRLRISECLLLICSHSLVASRGCLCLTGEFVQLREAVNKSRHQHQLTSVIDIELYSNKNKKK